MDTQFADKNTLLTVPAVKVENPSFTILEVHSIFFNMQDEITITYLDNKGELFNSIFYQLHPHQVKILKWIESLHKKNPLMIIAKYINGIIEIECRDASKEGQASRFLKNFLDDIPDLEHLQTICIVGMMKYLDERKINEKKTWYIFTDYSGKMYKFDRLSQSMNLIAGFVSKIVSVENPLMVKTDFIING